jgi:tetratricopeptide (TPR) repeat protein
LLVLAAYGAEALGMSEPAARLWSEVHPSNRDDRLALVRFWQAAAAQEIVKKEVGAVTLAESNKVRLWDAMLFYAAAADWEKADQFAGQYLAVRPEFALGRLVRLWIALRRGQPEEARKWSEELAAFPTANAEYALCRAMQNSGQWDLGRLARIGSDKEKNDALLWAVLVPLAQGQRAEALAHIRSAEKNLDHGSWAFSFLWSVEGWLEAPASPGPAQAQQ